MKIGERKRLLAIIEEQAVEKNNLLQTIGALKRKEVEEPLKFLREIRQHVVNIEGAILGREQPKIEMTATPVSDETMNKLTRNGEKRTYKRRRRHLKGKMINDTIAKRITENMRTTLLEHRYQTIIDYLHGGGKSTIKDVAESTHISEWNVLAHLRYGKETGNIKGNKKKGFMLTKDGEELWNTLIQGFKLPEKKSLSSGISPI